MENKPKYSPNIFNKEQRSEDTKNIRLLALLRGLAKCKPVSDSLLFKLYRRIGIALN